MGSVVDHKFLLFYANNCHRYSFCYCKTKREYTHPLAQQLTGCPMCLSRGLPRAECWGRLASDLTVNYKRLVWPVYTRTTRGSLLLRGRWGPLWAVAVRSRRSGFCVPSSFLDRQPAHAAAAEAIVFMHARENHAAAYGCKETRDFSRTDFRSYLLLQRGSGEL